MFSVMKLPVQKHVIMSAATFSFKCEEEGKKLCHVFSLLFLMHKFSVHCFGCLLWFIIIIFNLLLSLSEGLLLFSFWEEDQMFKNCLVVWLTTSVSFTKFECWMYRHMLLMFLLFSILSSDDPAGTVYSYKFWCFLIC